MAAFEFFFLSCLNWEAAILMSVRKNCLTDFASLWLLLKRSKLPVLHCWPLRLAAGKLHSPAEETTVQTRSAATLAPRSCPYDSFSLVLSWTPLSHGHIQSRLQVSSLSFYVSSVVSLLVSPLVVIPAVPSNTNVQWCVHIQKNKKVDAPKWNVILSSSSYPWRFRTFSTSSVYIFYIVLCLLFIMLIVVLNVVFYLV